MFFGVSDVIVQSWKYARMVGRETSDFILPIATSKVEILTRWIMKYGSSPQVRLYNEGNPRCRHAA